MQWERTPVLAADAFPFYVLRESYRLSFFESSPEMGTRHGDYLLISVYHQKQILSREKFQKGKFPPFSKSKSAVR